MSDETLRKLIEVVGTVLAALIGAASAVAAARIRGPGEGGKPASPTPTAPAPRQWKLVALVIVGGLVGALLGYFLVFPALSHALIPPKPALAITQPQGGSFPRSVVVRGTYANLPHDHNIWLLVYCHTVNKYYPQSPSIRLFETSEWQGQAFIGREGGQDKGRSYDIIVALADETAHRKLMQYWEQAKATQDHRGLDVLPDSLRFYDHVTVTRQ